jgi:hypothetical protein
MWGRTAWGMGPWASAEVPAASPGTGTLPPPIPGATSSFTFAGQSGTGPWAMRSWAGAMPILANPGGGISIAPDPATGVMRIWAWWPDASVLQLIRIGPDGKRTGVRGGYPVMISTPTRKNWATNPSVETGLNGYVPGTGSPTLSQIARAGEPSAGVFAWRATIAGAGTNEVTIPHSLPAQAVTIALDLQISDLPTGVTISLGWNNSVGGALTASSVALTPSQRSASVDQYARQVVMLTPPAGAATAGSLKITATGLPAGATMDGDRVLAEVGVSDGSYFDGASLGGVWGGTAHLSTSRLASVQVVDDGECPLDVAVRYELYNPALNGGIVSSPFSTLASEENVWLTHPEEPDTPVKVLITQTPDVDYVLEQALFTILDSPYPVSVSSSTRTAPSGALSVLVETFAERDRFIYDLFGNGTPVLLRCPDRYGYGEGQWIVLGTIREVANGSLPWDQIRTLEAGYQEVEEPADTVAA